MARSKKMANVAKKCSRLEQLKNLAIVLAKQMDIAQEEGDYRAIPYIAKQYRETIKEIENIEGVTDDDDDIGEILQKRKADGKPTSIR